MIYNPYKVNTTPYTEYFEHTRTAHAQMRVPSATGQKMLVTSETNNVSNAICYSARAQGTSNWRAPRLYRELPAHFLQLFNLAVTVQFEIYREK
jgi:hypothetical protein